MVMKYKRRKGYRRRQGHRQQYSIIRVKDITASLISGITAVIRIKVETTSGGLITAYSAEGHAVNEETGSIGVCAAVSALSRSAASVLRNLPHIALTGSAPQPGNVCFYVNYEAGAPIERALGVCDTVLNGLSAIALENPGLVKLSRVSVPA